MNNAGHLLLFLIKQWKMKIKLFLFQVIVIT